MQLSSRSLIRDQTIWFAIQRSMSFTTTIATMRGEIRKYLGRRREMLADSDTRLLCCTEVEIFERIRIDG